MLCTMKQSPLNAGEGAVEEAVVDVGEAEQHNSVFPLLHTRQVGGSEV